MSGFDLGIKLPPGASIVTKAVGSPLLGGAKVAEGVALAGKIAAGGLLIKNLIVGTPTPPTSGIRSSVTTSNLEAYNKLSASDINVALNETALGDSHIVRLYEKVGAITTSYTPNGAQATSAGNVLDNFAEVKFVNSPTVVETRNAKYEAIQAAHMPAEFQKYQGTSSTEWTISAKLTSVNRKEAFDNYKIINTLRAWMLPFFGDKITKARSPENVPTRQQSVDYTLVPFWSANKLGAPPPVLMFAGWRGLVGAVPVVVKNVTWSWPNECDWIPIGDVNGDGAEIPFPVVMDISVSIVESYSAAQINGLNLLAAREGDWTNTFSTTKYEASAAPELTGTSKQVKYSDYPDSFLEDTTTEFDPLVQDLSGTELVPPTSTTA